MKMENTWYCFSRSPQTFSFKALINTVSCSATVKCSSSLVSMGRIWPHVGDLSLDTQRVEVYKSFMILTKSSAFWKLSSVSLSSLGQKENMKIRIKTNYCHSLFHNWYFCLLLVFLNWLPESLVKWCCLDGWTHITIDKTTVERVNSFKFLCVHITEDLTWSTHTDAVLKKAHQHLFFLRRLRKFGTSPSILRSFYTCTVESILTSCITAWFGNNRKALQRVVRTARHIVGGELPSLQDIYTRRCIKKARRIIKDSSHPSHSLLSLLPSGRRLRSIRSCTSRLRDSVFPQAIRLMKSSFPVAQLVEHGAINAKIMGSIPREN